MRSDYLILIIAVTLMAANFLGAAFTIRRLRSTEPIGWPNPFKSALHFGAFLETGMAYVIRPIIWRRRRIPEPKQDPLTHLPNRTTFEEYIAANIERAKVSGGSFAVLSIDLKQFKSLNDMFGHQFGDELLCDVAGRMRLAAPDSMFGLAGRVGGNVFAIVSPIGPQPATAESLAHRINTAMLPSFKIAGQLINVGFTIGAAVYPQDGIDAATLLANANSRGKSDLPGSVRFFETSKDQQLSKLRFPQKINKA